MVTRQSACVYRFAILLFTVSVQAVASLLPYSPNISPY
jgi:hypothetical protein